MKLAIWGLVVLAIAALGLYGMQILASERVEVVELLARDSADGIRSTRLWVVDDEGYQYLRVGANGSAWFDRIQDKPGFELRRGDLTVSYRAEPRPDKQERINQLMRDKYTWGDALIAVLVGSREGSMPIELHPFRCQSGSGC